MWELDGIRWNKIHVQSCATHVHILSWSFRIQNCLVLSTVTPREAARTMSVRMNSENLMIMAYVAYVCHIVFTEFSP